MKQTAVEWLEQKIDGTINTMPLGNRLFVKKALRQAKEMENQQNLDMLIKFTDERTFLRKEVTKIWFEQFKKK